jgi:hypothetical protein
VKAQLMAIRDTPGYEQARARLREIFGLWDCPLSLIYRKKVLDRRADKTYSSGW